MTQKTLVLLSNKIFGWSFAVKQNTCVVICCQISAPIRAYGTKHPTNKPRECLKEAQKSVFTKKKEVANAGVSHSPWMGSLNI